MSTISVDAHLEKLLADKPELQSRYDSFKSQGLNLDMTRGKPAPEQLDLANAILDLPGQNNFKSEGGTDARNYGGVEGLPELRKFFGDFLEARPEEVIIGGNASLTLMHDTVVRALTHGVPDGEKPWSAAPVKFLCPAPGYDRHFAICEHFGVEMITVDMRADGPDMDRVEELVAADPAVKGIWCVPKYSNPTGAIFSDQVVDRLARMKTAAPDFRIFWDNAYAYHHLNGKPAPLKNLLRACEEQGNPNRALIFGSTSKISLAGAGLSAMAASVANIADAKKHLTIQTIGPDKVNQLRHIQFFKDMDGLREHMNKHAAILKPKFDAVGAIFENELGDKNLATWSSPRGGYFIDVNTLDGCAARTVELASRVGVKLTNAGATFPYGKDPRDRNLRIAPSLPSLTEIQTAMEVVAVCIQLASLEKYK